MRCILCQQIMKHSIVNFNPFYHYYRCINCLDCHQSYYLVICDKLNKTIKEHIEMDEICVDQYLLSNPPLMDIFLNKKLILTLTECLVMKKIDPAPFRNKIQNYILFE